MGSEDNKIIKEDERKLKIIIGKRFRQLRESYGLSQEEIAEEIGISPRQIYNYESGKSGIPDTTKVRIRKRFRITIDELMLGDEAGIDFQDEEEVRKMNTERLFKYAELLNGEIKRRFNRS